MTRELVDDAANLRTAFLGARVPLCQRLHGPIDERFERLSSALRRCREISSLCGSTLDVAQLGRDLDDRVHRVGVVTGRKHGPQRHGRSLQRLVEGCAGSVFRTSGLFDETVPLRDVLIGRNVQQHACVGGGVARHRRRFAYRGRRDRTWGTLVSDRAKCVCSMHTSLIEVTHFPRSAIRAAHCGGDRVATRAFAVATA